MYLNMSIIKKGGDPNHKIHTFETENQKQQKINILLCNFLNTSFGISVKFYCLKGNVFMFRANV